MATASLGREIVVISADALRQLAEAAFVDINHLLRPSHLRQLRAILGDPEATENDKFVAHDMLKNANISAGGVLPKGGGVYTAELLAKFVATEGRRRQWTERAKSKSLQRKYVSTFLARY